MNLRVSNFLFSVAFLAGGVQGFTPKSNGSSPSSLSYSTPSTAGVAEVPKIESFRNSILRNYQPEEPPVSLTQVLTEQVGRELTKARRYLLAATALKEFSDDFYDAEETQRFRAIELIELARNKGITLSDYAGHVESSPIDKSLAPEEFLNELIHQEKQDMQVLDQLLAQATSNQDLVTFLQSIRAEQVERQQFLMHTLNEVSNSIDADTVVNSAATTSAVAQTAGDTVSSSNDIVNTLNEDIFSKADLDQLRQSINRLTENGMHGVGRHLEALLSKASTVTGATAATATVAAATVDPDSLPEDILQAVDGAATLFEEPMQFVDQLQALADAESVSQIIDIVSGLY